jgi:hypothetical protein
MERFSWNSVNVAYRVEKKSGNTPEYLADSIDPLSVNYTAGFRKSSFKTKEKGYKEDSLFRGLLLEQEGCFIGF